MTRKAVIQGFEEFISEAIAETMAEFSVSRALRHGVHGPGSRVVDQLVAQTPTIQQEVVQPELRSYREQTCDQFGVILDYAESSEPIDAYRHELLDAGAFASKIRTDISATKQQAARDALIDQHERLGDAVVPLIESAEPTFWDAVRETLTVSESKELVETHFAFSQPIREHRTAFRLATTLDLSALLGGLGLLPGTPTVSVEYTDEALRALRHAEQQVAHKANAEITKRL